MEDTIFKLAKLKKLHEITCEIEKNSKNLEFSIRGKDELGKNYIINFGAGPIEEMMKFKISEKYNFTNFITDGRIVYFSVDGLTEIIDDFETNIIQYLLGKFVLTMKFESDFEEIVQIETTFNLK